MTEQVEPIKVVIMPSANEDKTPDGKFNVFYLAGAGHRPVITIGFPTFEDAAAYARKMVLETRDDVTWKPLTPPPA